ncbi:MAG: hypothetical protein OXB88_01665 [Bacteriovoracales bacterium]|nr:hypothetical protein [Bacteriovoracales bacterium]
MDTGRILFRPGEKDDIFKKDLKTKIKEFFSWYGSLQNKTPIKTVKVFSNDYKCPNRCSIRDANLSVVNDLVTPNELMGLLQTVAQNYDVSLDISLKDLI